MPRQPPQNPHATDDVDMDSSQQSSVRHRNRRVNTCLECRRLKRKCSRTQPCTHCVKTARECIYPAASASSGSRTHDGRGQGTPQSAPGLLTPKGLDGVEVQRRLSDLCLLIGRLNITERIGGLDRADIVPFLENLLQKRPELLGQDGVDQTSAPIVVWFKPHTPMPLGRLLAGSVSGLDEDVFVDFSEAQERAILDHFFSAVYPLCPLASEADLDEEDDFTHVLRLSMLYAAAVSMPMLECQRVTGEPKDSIVKRLKAATEFALCAIDIFNCLDLKMFQAVLIYLTPQFLAEISRSQSIFIAAVIRHFQIAGYDKDTKSDTYSSRQLRKHLWHTLLFLNLRATETVGPETALLDDETAELPNRGSLDAQTSLQPSDVSIVAMVRYECSRIHRKIFRERGNIDKGLTTFETAMELIDDSVQLVRRTYIDTLNTAIPIQKYAGVVGRLLLARCVTMMLATQWADLRNSANPLGVRDRSIQSNLEMLEAAVLLETSPDFAPWAWYSGAYHQYHSIIFPLCQLFLEPDLRDGERIMAMVNYVFGPSSTAPKDVRSASILRAIKDNMASFLAAIGAVVPSQSEERRYEPAAGQLWTGVFDLPQTSFDEMDRGYLEHFGSNTVSPFGPGAGADTWWKWPLPGPPEG